jgi:hypothetical protein
VATDTFFAFRCARHRKIDLCSRECSCQITPARQGSTTFRKLAVNNSIKTICHWGGQCDEIWCFVGAKHKNASPEQKARRWSDVWTWTAIDADTKLCVGYLLGGPFYPADEHLLKKD